MASASQSALHTATHPAYRAVVRAITFALILSSLVVGAPEQAQAATITVCPSGCDYTHPDAAANDPARVAGDVILIEPGLYEIGSSLQLDYDVLIAGSGSADTIIDATEFGVRPIDIESGAVVELSGLTVRGGYAAEASGGGISVVGASMATLTDVWVVSNTADGRGGGIRNTGSELTLIDSVVDSNYAAGDGGGIHTDAEGSTTLVNTTISSNIAVAGGGMVVDSAHLAVTNSLVESNSATSNGGGILNTSGSLDVVASLITANSAPGSLGGGIAAIGADSLTSVAASTLAGNVAEAGGGIGNDGGSVSVTFSTVSSNEAAGGGGVSNVTGSLELDGSIVAENLGSPGLVDCAGPLLSGGHNLVGEADCEITPVAGDLFGASGTPLDPDLDLLAANGGPTRTMALLADSPAIDAGGACEGFDQRGEARPQGVACDIGAFETASSTPSIQDRLDLAGPGGTVVLPEGVYFEDGIVIGEGQTLAGEGLVTISGAEGEGGSIIVAGFGDFSLENLTLADGSAISGGALRLGGTGSVATLDSVNFSANHGLEGGGAIYVGPGDTLDVSAGTFAGNSSDGHGGAIHNDGGTVTVGSSTFTGNSAVHGASISNHGVLSIEGGDPGCTTPSDPASFAALTTFSGGEATGEGGAIFNDAGTLTVHQTRFTENSATQGGAIFGTAGSVTIGCSVFDADSATLEGGAVFSTDDQVSVSHTLFQGNTARSGGAVYSDGTLAMLDSVLIGNQAVPDGSIGGVGGAVLQPFGDMELLNTTINSNSARFGGGFSAGGDLSVTGSTFSGNTTAGDEFDVAGAGLLVYGNATMANSTVSGNEATTGSGGGIAVSGEGTIALNQTTIVDNHADAGSGGGVYNSSGTLTIANSLVAFNSAAFQAECGNSTSLGYNFFRRVGDCDPAATDIGGVESPIDPLIGPLADNGGPTLTHILLSGSPAIDAADPGSVLAELEGSIAGGLVMAQSTGVLPNPDGVLTNESEAGSFFAESAENTPFDLTKSFSTSFAFVLDPVQSLGEDASGDGITFAVVPDQGFLGELGGRLGVGTAGGNPSVAVEFDTFFNAFAGADPDGNHVGVDVGGISNGDAVLSIATATVPFALDPDPVLGDQTRWAWIDYTAGTGELSVSVATSPDRPAEPLLVAVVDIAAEVGTTGYFGFTGAGAAAWADQRITSWELVQSTCEPTDQRGALRPAGAACDMGSVEVAGAPPSLAGVLQTVDTNTTEPGVIEVPLLDIPIERITGAGTAVEASPLASIPLASIPLASIDLSASPLASIPLASIPLASITVEGSPLASIPLASIPLASIGGWSEVLRLADSPYRNTPLQAVTLADLDPNTLASVDLADITIQGSPLASITLPSIAMGPATMAQVDTTEDLCSNPALSGFTCDPATTTLFDLEVQGAPLASIPLASIPLASIDLASTPLASIPLASIPLASIPLASIPLASIEVEGAPLASIPLASITPGSTPLASIDLLVSPLASIPLASIPLASIPLASITIDDQAFCEYLIADDGSSPCDDLGIDAGRDGIADLIAALAVAIPNGTLADSPLASIPLASIDISDAPLASIPLASTDLAGTPLASIPLASIDLGGATFCDFLGLNPASGAFWCSELGIDGTESLLDLIVALEAAGSTIADTPLASIPLASIPLASIPLASIDLAATDLAGTPLASIPLSSIDILGSPLASIPLASTGGVVTCDVVTECPTLGDAVALSALSPNAALGDLSGAFGTITFGDLVGALTLSFILGDGTFGDTDEFGGLTFGQLLMSMLLASDYPWEELDLDVLGVQEFSPDNFIEYAIEFDLDGTGPPQATAVTATLPGAFLYVEDSSGLQVGGDPAVPVADPVLTDEADGSQTLVFDLADLAPGTQYRLLYDVVPALRLGSFDVAASVEVVGLPPETADSSSASVKVIEAASTDAGDPSAPAETAADVLYLGTISSVDDIDFFQVPAPPKGYRVAVFLSNLNSDADLVMYRPVTAPIESARTVPLDGVPVEDDGIDYSSNATEEPDTLADISLLAAPLASISTNRGTAPESASALSAADPFTIQVSGYNGDTSDEPYVLRVKIAPEVPTPQCSPRTFPFPVPAGGPGPVALDDASLPAGLNAVYFVNWQRLASTEGVDPATGELYADTILQELEGSPTDPANVPGLVDRPDLGITGIVIPVEHMTDYTAWDANPCDPDAANAVADSIVAAVGTIADLRPSLRYVTMVGSDEVIPMVRKPDLTSIANESTFTSDFVDNALYGSAVTRHYLSDDPYGDLDPIPWLDRYLNVPELSLGRLVEGGAEIVGAIRTFNQFGGALDPQTALTTGYDFLYDGSLEVDEAISTYVPTSNALLDDVGVDPAQAWGLTELRTALGLELATPDLPDIAALSMHYDFDEALPSKGDATGDSVNDLFDVTQIEGLDQEGSVYFTAGCHAGLSVADVAVGQGLPARDWVQTYAENGAVYAAPTGYGYGDTVSVALTEKLMAEFARNLNGSLTVGQAMTFAKQAYFKDLGLYGTYDEKALQEATFYGLPMYTIGEGAATTPPAPLETATDPATGLSVASISVEPPITQSSTVNGDLFSVDGDTQFVHYRPLQPIVRADITQPGLLAHGALLTGLVTRDLFDVDIAFGRPIIDSSEIEPEVETDEIAFPTTFASVNLYNGPPGPETPGPAEPRQQLNVIVGQFTSPADGSTTGTERLFTSFDAQVFYAEPSATDFSEPNLALIQAGLVGDHATFSVTTNDEGDPDGVKRVVALYRASIDLETGEALWSGVDLVQTGDTWTGGGPVDPNALVDGKLDYMIQAVDAVGNVAVSTFKGLFHEAAPLPDPPLGDPNEPGTQVEISGTQGDNGWYLDAATVIVTEPAGVTYEYSVNGSPFLPVPDTGIVVTAEGVNIVVIRGSDGSEVVFGILIDTQDPLIVIHTPSDGAVVEQGSGATADYDCVDAGSGITDCSGTVPDGGSLGDSAPGAASLAVTASDNSGRDSAATVDYFVVSPISLDGPTEPLALGDAVTITGQITDSPYVETLSWDWESDGTIDESCSDTPTSTCSILPAADEGRLDILGTHVYDEPGVYTVTATVDHGGVFEQEAVFEFAVVYDPNGAFVTGGGFFQSPPEAYTPDDPTDISPEQGGKAAFGFVSKYRRGRTVPDGNAHFQIQTAGFRFRAVEYEWLLVSGARARFQGVGVVNEDPRLYQFRITVLDADENPSDVFDTDRYRIRIWFDEATPAGGISTVVLYDNGFGADDASGDGGTTEIDGGAIVIHSARVR